MTAGRFRFGRFELDPANRRLDCNGARVDLNARYLDALALLVREQGRLVSKAQFMESVWRGVPVTDEALTQCIRTLRRQLGDDAARPRFIETVPKHGYRFIAAVEHPRAPAPLPDLRAFALRAGAGTLGGGLAGAIGGTLYGFAASAQPLPPGVGVLSLFFVLLTITAAIALIGGAGVAVGIAAAPRRSAWTIAGGALGGLAIGALVKIVGLDAFGLLFGQTPGDITGAGEGALLGGAVGLGAWLAERTEGRWSLRRRIAAAALAGAAGGMAVTLLGGRLMAGSLDLLARHVPASRLRLDAIGALMGETGFGFVSRLATATLEGALFGACIVGAMALANRAASGSSR